MYFVFALHSTGRRLTFLCCVDDVVVAAKSIRRDVRALANISPTALVVPANRRSHANTKLTIPCVLV